MLSQAQSGLFMHGRVQEGCCIVNWREAFNDDLEVDFMAWHADL